MTFKPFIPELPMYYLIKVENKYRELKEFLPAIDDETIP
jgi:hypothetical protein